MAHDCLQTTSMEGSARNVVSKKLKVDKRLIIIIRINLLSNLSTIWQMISSTTISAKSGPNVVNAMETMTFFVPKEGLTFTCVSGISHYRGWGREHTRVPPTSSLNEANTNTRNTKTTMLYKQNFKISYSK